MLSQTRNLLPQSSNGLYRASTLAQSLQRVGVCESIAAQRLPSSMAKISLPHRFTRRPYQEEVAGEILSGRIRRAVKVWHRRAGKDKDDWNLMIEAAGNPDCPIFRVGTYFYIFPTYTQGKKVIWDGIDADGLRVRDHIPPELVVSTNATEMKITLT